MKKLFLTTIAAIGLSLSWNAQAVVIDFDSTPFGEYILAPLSLNGYTFAVLAGHYDIFAPLGDGDNIFNIDSAEYGLPTISVTKDDGGLFDAVSMDVYFAANVLNQFGIVAIGGAGIISAPLSTGVFSFGAGFQGISALVFTQNSGPFSFFSVSMI